MIRIIPYNSAYQADFKQLNLAWLDQYQLTESHDLEILDDPEGTVLAGDGCLFLAMDDEKVVGTAGLWKVNDDEFELIKMSVDSGYRGRGISKLLLDVCLQEARRRNARKMMLFSNSQLTAALSLYEKAGFRKVEVTDAPFMTADVKMELSLAL